MSLKMCYDRSMDDSTAELNQHFTGILKPGVYDGMLVLSNKNSSNITVTPGAALDASGQMVTSDASEIISGIPVSHPTYDRVDTVCLVIHNDITLKYNTSYFTYLKGNPSRTPTPVDMTAYQYHMAIAHIYVKAGSTIINQNDIHQINRVYNNTDLTNKIIKETFNTIYGNRLIEGFSLSVNSTNESITLTKGKVIIDGALMTTNEDTVIKIPRMPFKLKESTATNIANVSNIQQPYIPTKLEIVLTLSDVSQTGTVIVTGKNGNGVLISETISTREDNSTPNLVIFRTTGFFSIIDGIQINSFTANVSKVTVRGLNELNVYVRRHDIGTLAPIEYTYKTKDMVDPQTHFLLGTIVSKYDGAINSLTIKQESPKASQPMFGIIMEGSFNGKEGTVINHGLNISDVKKYTVITTPVNTDYNNASQVGTVWVNKEPNRITVYNAGSARCSFDATITVGV